MSTSTPAAIAASAPCPSGHWVGEYFRRLGNEIERRTREIQRDGERFAEIATQVLTEFPPSQPIDAAAMADWIASGETLAQQINFHVRFGQPPLVVHVGAAFYLEVLFWFPSRTGIHGHGFSGAFRVLDGYSIQTTYAFAESETVAPGLRVGELQVCNLELLMAGQVCDIRADEAFVHSVAHMGFPSLTLVARTFRESDVTQYTYLRCGVAYAPFRRAQELRRQLDVLLAFGRRDQAAAVERTKEFLERQDDHGRFVTCLQLAAMPAAPIAVAVLAAAERSWPRVTALARAAAAEDARRDRTYAHIAQLPDAQSQLMAALGEVLGSRDETLKAVAKFHPALPPEATIAQWAGRVPALPKLPRQP